MKSRQTAHHIRHQRTPLMMASLPKFPFCRIDGGYRQANAHYSRDH
ncbi:MAG: hypothetical protein ACYDBB_03025 [Armatimonadota bacterium]